MGTCHVCRQNRADMLYAPDGVDRPVCGECFGILRPDELDRRLGIRKGEKNDGLPKRGSA